MGGSDAQRGRARHAGATVVRVGSTETEIRLRQKFGWNGAVTRLDPPNRGSAELHELHSRVRPREEEK